ncbi:MAG: BTAD domain-containing putative transcriptional regulator [Gordonia sp. (in: high G+C Gram-positive bacteria)]|uniref:BTAD domain-containing putative transcriptional regulator n=1 Tax=Gordonia sp. (in: high G+C Gram-positive bacteria) TaxID=84139 RepID=UPI0039E3B1D8
MAREYLVLGPLEVRRDGDRVELGPPKQRVVLGALLVARGAVVSVDRLVDTVWPDDPPEAATTSLQAYISNLRRLLRGDAGEPSPIERVAGGYRLDPGQGRLDLAEFLDLAREAQRAREDGRWEDALTASADATGLWRGDLLGAEADGAEWLAAESLSLRETLAAVGETQVSALLAAGDTGSALAEIVAARATDPFRERAVWLHMVALYRAGRAAEALDAYTDYQRRLDEELGLDPGVELVDLHGAILRQDPSLAAWPRPPHWSGAAVVESPVDAGPMMPAETDRVGAALPLVGRGEQVAGLAETVAAPGAHWALLTGPAGIGKTRLAQEAASLASAAGREVLWVRCPDTEGTPAWWPLRQLCRELGADPDDVLAVPDGASADTARFAVYERVQHLLDVNAAARPLTIIVDDVQWADAMTLGLLSFLVTALRDTPITFVGTIRDGEGGAEVERFREAVSRAGGTTMVVPRLEPAEVAVLVQEVADVEPDEESLAALVRRTDGNPLFVSEFARLPVEQQRADMVPDAVRSVLDRRLGSLDPAVLEVIAHAAVLGEDVDVALLSAVCGRDLDDVADCLDEAVDERILVTDQSGGRARFAHALLREQALSSIRPLRRCRIHLRVAEALVDSPAADAKASRAAHLLDALPVADASDAVAACRAAAEDALRHWDSESAARWLAAALRTREEADPQAADVDDLLIDLLNAQARAGHLQEVIATVEERLNLAIRAGRTTTAGRVAGVLIRAAGAWPWIGPHVEAESLRAVLAETAGFVADDPASLARVLAASALGESYARDAAVPAALLERADAAAASAGGDAASADVTLAKLITYSCVAPFAEASFEWAEQLRRSNHPDRDVDNVIVDTVMTTAAMLLGDVGGAEDLTRRAIAASERLCLPIVRAQLRWMQASLAVWHGRFDLAKDHFRTAIAVHEDTQLYVAGSGALAMMALATEQGVLGEFIDTGGMLPVDWAKLIVDQFTDNQVMVMLAAGVAAIAGAEGDRELAEKMVRSWLADDRAMVWTSLGNAVLLAGVVADLGLVEYAPALRDYLADYSKCIAVTGHVGCVGPVALYLAELAFLLGDTAAADELVATAWGIARRGDGKPSILRCRLLMARMHPDQPGRRAELADIEARAGALGTESVAAAARALLAD